MKTLSFLVLTTSLLAQAPAPVQRTPREPSIGDTTKAAPTAADAQSPVDVPQLPPQQTADQKRPLPEHLRRAIEAAVPQTVLFDRANDDGRLWALGADYKAVFAADTWSFIARPDADAEQLEPLQFALTAARVGGGALPIAAHGDLQHDGERVHLQHGAVRETIELLLGGAEQSFTFTALPRRGELVLEIAVRGALQGGDAEQGLRFSSQHTDVRYSDAVAIDANGATVPAATEWRGDHIEIRVPAEFVATAALPLVVDPLISSGTVTSGTADVGNPDLVFVPATNEWLVTYQKLYAPGDWDCWVQRMNASFQPVGAPTAIDFTSNSFFRPRVAHLRFYGVSMVVGELRFGSIPVKIVGRIVDNAAATTTAQFDISSATAVSSYVPDVGADCYGGAGYFTVVWEHAYSSTDHDIYARQVTNTGTLRGTGPIYVQASGAYESNPSISKSDGGQSFGDQRYAIVYQRQAPNLDWDILGAMLSWDGVLQLFNGTYSFPIETSISSTVLPNVSAPTLSAPNGERYFLCVYESVWSNAGDIEMAAFDLDGNVMVRNNLVWLEQSPLRLGWPQHFPSVACDGTRFAVAYHENWNNSATDLDVRIATVAYGNGQLFAMDSAAAAATGAPEFAAQIASRYASSGLQDQGHATVNDYDNAGTFRIDGGVYTSAPTGQVLQRATACGGGVTINWSGNMVPGGSLLLSLASSAPIAGFAIGGANSASLPGCGCIVGVDPWLTTVGGFQPIDVPASPLFVGVQLSAQGWMFGAPGTSCLFDIHLSDTLDLTVR
ncbi:MAG: hypothetical protein H6835_03320 [Planctomycetes bacterium]|nr:hypothetical protein [Planctomycetota bacterium]